MGAAPAKRLGIALAVLVVVQLALLAVYLLGRDRAGSSGGVDFAFERPGGESARLSDLRGRPVLVHLWATWCEPCRRELPDLLAYARESPVPVLAVSVDDDWPALRAYFAEGVPEAVVRAGEPGLAARFGVPGLPATIVVDAGGAVVQRRLGVADWTSPDVRARFEQAAGVGTEAR